MTRLAQHTDKAIAQKLKDLDGKLLLTPEAHNIVKDAGFCHERKDGFIHYGVASNNRVVEKTLQYMPSYLDEKCCGYEEFRGPLFLREYFSKNTGYTPDETIVINGMSAIIDLLSEEKKVFYEGKRPDFYKILDHSQGTRTTIQESQVIFVEI